MRSFDIMSLTGMLVGFVLVISGIMLQGDLGAFWNPAGLLITLGGSWGALMVNFRADEIKTAISMAIKNFASRKESMMDIYRRLIYLAQRAKKEGLLVLEDELVAIEDPFFKNGLQMVVDGFDPEVVRKTLYAELDSLDSRYTLGENFYRTWGALTPAFGMIGTLIGLVMMLSRLDDPSAIGPGLAVALLTTFYGVLLANLIFIPLAGKLRACSDAEIRVKELLIEALLAIQKGVSPRLLQEQFKAYLSPAERSSLEEEGSEAAHGQVEEAYFGV